MSAHIGKIGHLPGEIREQLNWAICDGIPGNRLVGWLNNLPEVQAILAQDFDGRPITTVNLTKWCKTGLREWKQEQMFKEALAKVAEKQWHATFAQIEAAQQALHDYEI
jgi:hypothetical protein